MSKPIINALTLAIIGWGDRDWPVGVPEARDMAAEFIEENAELFTAPPTRAFAPQTMQAADSPPRERMAWEAGDTAVVRQGDDNVAPRLIVAQRGADGLTESQRKGVDRGIPLCPNCQQPTDAHLPGCARAGETPMNPKAVTRSPLPPSA